VTDTRYYRKQTKLDRSFNRSVFKHVLFLRECDKQLFGGTQYFDKLCL